MEIESVALMYLPSDSRPWQSVAKVAKRLRLAAFLACRLFSGFCVMPHQTILQTLIQQSWTISFRTGTRLRATVKSYL